MRPSRISLFAPGGAPTLGRVPTRLVSSGPLSAGQRAALDGLYDAFYTNCQLSLANSQVLDRVLPDGSRVRMFSNQGLDTVLVWPVQADKAPDGWWVAYPAFVDLTYSPVFDREVIDLGGALGPLPPKEPKFKEPAPERSYVSYTLQILIEGQITETETSRISATTTSVVAVFGADIQRLFSVDGTYTQDLRMLYGTQDVVSNSPGPGLLKEYPRDDPEYAPGKIKPVVRDWGASGTPGVPPGEACSPYVRAEDGSIGPVLFSGTYPSGPNTALYWAPSEHTGTPNFALWEFMLAQYAAMSAAQAVADAQYAELEAAWRARYNTWLTTVYKRWLDATRGRDGSSVRAKYTPITGKRIEGRKRQVAALHKFLDEGPNHPHLAARHLSFPFNIGTRPAAPVPTTEGEVAISGPFDIYPNGKYLKYEATGASARTEVPDFVADPDVPAMDKLGFVSIPPHPLGTVLAMPSCLYGWQASGVIERRAEHRPWHGVEAAEMAKVKDLSFSVNSGYSEFLAQGVVSSKGAAGQTVICSDGYVPPGTKITKVRIEYECWDPFTATWVWTPLTSLVQVDAVWIVSLDDLADVERVDMPQPLGSTSPRAARFRGAQKQTRLKSMLWSASEPVPCKAWSMEAEEAPPVPRRDYPTDIVIVEGLPPTARASPEGSNVFPFGAYSTFSNDPTLSARINSAFPSKFISLDTLLVQAVKATSKPITP